MSVSVFKGNRPPSIALWTVGSWLMLGTLAPSSTLAQTAADNTALRSASEPNEARPPQMTRAPSLRTFVEATLPTNTPPPTQRAVVRLAFTVLATGDVVDVEVIGSASPALDAAALTATQQFQFDPAEVDGTPAPVRIQYEYVFEPPAATHAPVLDPTPSPQTSPSETIATGILRGQLLERGTGEPVVGAMVQLPDLGLEALTDAEGRFEFSHLAEGAVRLAVTDAEHAAVEDSENILEATVTEVTYYAQPTGFGSDDLVALGRRVHKQVVQRQVSVREVTTVPGSNGDALKAVQNLPGVARTNGDDIVMRGVSNARVLVNGHPILIAFHFGGLRSTVANGLIRSLEVTPGNYDARYGGTNGGVVNIETRRPDSERLRGYAQVDLFDASAFVEGPVGDHGAFALGGRRSYIDTVLPLALDEEEQRLFSVAPRYYDGQATYDWKLGKDRFRLIGLTSSDQFVFLIEDPEPSDPAERGQIDLSLRWATTQALWDRQLDSKTKLSLGASYLWAEFSQTFQALRLHLETHTVTTRAEVLHQLSPTLQLRAGIDSNVQFNDADANIPRPDGEGQPLEVSLANAEYLTTKETPVLYNPSSYFGANWETGPLKLNASLRVEYFSRPNTWTGTVVLAPRLNARLALGSSTELAAGVGWYSEAPDIVETNEVFGNPKTQPSRSRHYSVTVEQTIAPYVTAEATAFYQDLYDQVSPSYDPAIHYDNGGLGRVIGGEFLLRHAPGKRFYGWAAYTLMRSQRKDSGAADFRLFDQDQTHNLNVVGQYRLSPTWEVGARYRYVTGNPTSRVVRSIYNSDGDNFTPVYGAVNDTRLPSFQQLDVRVDKHWVFDTWRLTTYIDVQNALNRRNSEELNYNYNYRKSAAGAGLPLIPSFGLRGEF